MREMRHRKEGGKRGKKGAKLCAQKGAVIPGSKKMYQTRWAWGPIKAKLEQLMPQINETNKIEQAASSSPRLTPSRAVSLPINPKILPINPKTLPFNPQILTFTPKHCHLTPKCCSLTPKSCHLTPKVAIQSQITFQPQNVAVCPPKCCHSLPSYLSTSKR